jgi:hypothetical protein
LGGGAEAADWPLEARALLTRITTPRDPRGGERRTRERHTVRLRGTARIPGSRSPAEVFTRELTPRVVSFFVAQHIAENLLVELALEAPGETRKVLCRVRRCRQFREGWFEVYGQVESARRGLLGALTRLLGRLLPGGKSERP